MPKRHACKLVISTTTYRDTAPRRWLHLLMVALVGAMGSQYTGRITPAFALGATDAIRSLAPVAEIWVIVTEPCAACAEQVALAEQVGAQYGYRVAVIAQNNPTWPPMPLPLRSLIHAMQPTFTAKAPIVFVAVPRLPALLPLVSASSLPHSPAELTERLALVAELAQTPGTGAMP